MLGCLVPNKDLSRNKKYVNQKILIGVAQKQFWVGEKINFRDTNKYEWMKMGVTVY